MLVLDDALACECVGRDGHLGREEREGEKGLAFDCHIYELNGNVY